MRPKEGPKKLEKPLGATEGGSRRNFYEFKKASNVRFEESRSPIRSPVRSPVRNPTQVAKSSASPLPNSTRSAPRPITPESRTTVQRHASPSKATAIPFRRPTINAPRKIDVSPPRQEVLRKIEASPPRHEVSRKIEASPPRQEISRKSMPSLPRNEAPRKSVPSPAPRVDPPPQRGGGPRESQKTLSKIPSTDERKSYSKIKKAAKADASVSQLSLSSNSSSVSRAKCRRSAERSQVSQAGLRLDLADLLRIDEIFWTLVSERKGLDSTELLSRLHDFLVLNSSFVASDLSILFSDEKFRENMRRCFIKELLYFVYLFLFFGLTQLEVARLSERPGQSEPLAIKRDLLNAILQILGNLHVVFVLRAEVFLDAADTSFQDQTLLTRLRHLISRRKSNHKISAPPPGGAHEDSLIQICRYLYITEQALNQLFDISPGFKTMSHDLVDSMFKVTERRGPLTVAEFNGYLKPLGIGFDANGLSLFDRPVLEELIGARPSLPETIKEESVYRQETESREIIPEPPFLRSPLPKGKTFSLILDLDETLIHYPDEQLLQLEEKFAQSLSNEELSRSLNFKVRPFVYEFLRKIKPHFEIIIFTAASQMYADLVIDRFDRDRMVDHRFYRQHTSLHKGKLVKDIHKIGRDLSKIVILDNLPENFMLQPHNGIYVQSWTGNPDDRCLTYLWPFFLSIIETNPEDVRDMLQQIKVMLQGKSIE